MTTRQEIDKLEAELLNSIRTNEEFLISVNQLKSQSPEEQAAQLEVFQNRQKELDAMRHDLTTGTLKFKKSEIIKGNLLGEVRLGDIGMCPLILKHIRLA